MQRLNEDIKTKEFKQVYLLYGEETYLRNQYRDKLRDALLAGGDAMNLHCFSGKNINCKEIIDLAESYVQLGEVWWKKFNNQHQPYRFKLNF